MRIGRKYIWDYNAKKLDLSNRAVLLWHLSRMINCGQWSEIDAESLEKNIENLDIDSTLKGMFIKYYADKKSKNHS